MDIRRLYRALPRRVCIVLVAFIAGSIVFIAIGASLPSTNLVSTERAFPRCPLQDHLGDPTYVFTADFRHFADENELENGKSCVKKDGILGPPYDEINGYGFIGDSEELAYCARRGERWYVVVNGVETLECNGLYWGLASMGAGRYFLCVIKEGNQKRVVTGGHEEPSFDEIAAAALSRDGNRYGYLARRGEQWFCVVDGVQSPFDADHSKLGRQWRFTFSPDGKRYAFICQRREQWVVFLDGRELHAGEGIVCSSILFSPDGRHVVFVRQKQDKSETVVFDGVESRPYDGATMPAFSADSRHFGYTARFGDHWFVLVDGRETECKGLRFLDYPELTLSPDGRKYVYCRKRGYMQPDEIVVGGEDAHQVETGKYGIWGGHLVFSPDGRRFAYAARHFVVVDGLPGKEYRDVEEVLFTPDSKHVVSKVWKEEPRRNPTQFIVVDGSESRLYDDILYNNYREYVVFDSATAFHTIAVRDERYYLVEFRICGRWRAMLHYVCHLDIGDEWRRIVSACEQIETLILPPDS